MVKFNRRVLCSVKQLYDLDVINKAGFLLPTSLQGH